MVTDNVLPGGGTLVVVTSTVDSSRRGEVLGSVKSAKEGGRGRVFVLVLGVALRK